MIEDLEVAPSGARGTKKERKRVIPIRKEIVTPGADGTFPPDLDPTRGTYDPLDSEEDFDPNGLTPPGLREAHEEVLLPTEENEFYHAMRDGYDSLTNTVRDFRVDDRDFKLALNVYDFACNQMGKHAKKPFSRQLWILAVLSAEYCPRCADPNFLEVDRIAVDADPDEVAERMCLLEHGVCPSCGTGKSEMILSGELLDYVELVACLGQRSGKTVVSNTITAYWIHRILLIPPYAQLVSGIQDFSPLTFSLVALSFHRAYKLLWSPLVSVFNNSPFFVEYHKMLKDQGKKYGAELIALRKASIYYPHKNVAVEPMGPMGRKLRGDTRIGSSVDELGWFPLPKRKDDEDDAGNPEEIEREIANADEVYTALDRSLITIRSGVTTLYKKGYNHIPNGIGLFTSSPASHRDKIMTLLRESIGSKRSLGVNLPTWDVNPAIPQNDPDIVEAYRKNPVKADRDWAARPPNINAAIYSRETLEPLFRGDNHFAVSRVVTSSGKLYGRILPTKRKWVWPGSVLALDAGINNNSFAFAVVNGKYQDAMIGAEASVVGEVIPSKETPISFPLLYEHCLKPLIRACNVKFVVADRWNSAMLLQTIERDFPGVETHYIVMKGADFDKADADYVGTGLLSLPKMEISMDEAEKTSDYRETFSIPPRPASHLFLQFRTIRKTAVNRSKGEQYTDDIYRALMLGLTCLRNPKMEEVLRKSRALNTSLPDGGAPENVPIVSGRSYGRMVGTLVR